MQPLPDASSRRSPQAEGKGDGGAAGAAAVDFQGLLPVLSKVAGHQGGPLSPREKEQLRKEQQLLEVVVIHLAVVHALNFRRAGVGVDKVGSWP